MTMIIVSCKKDTDTQPRSPSASAPFVWEGVYYCASFVNTAGDTLCKKVVTGAQMDSMNYNYGAHIYCTYPNNTGITVSGKQINTASQCY